MQDLSDEQLVANYLKGNEQALEILVKRYLKPIYSFIYKNIGNSPEAENITQGVFIKVWKNLKKFNQQKSFKSWMFTIAKNSCIDFLREKRPLTIDGLEQLADLNNTPEQKIQAKQEVYSLALALAKISPKYKQVIILRYQYNFTFQKIAQQLNAPLNTVKSWHRRGLANLKEQLV